MNINERGSDRHKIVLIYLQPPREASHVFCECSQNLITNHRTMRNVIVGQTLTEEKKYFSEERMLDGINSLPVGIRSVK